MRSYKFIVIVFLSVSLGFEIKAQTGKLDPKFGDNGVVVHPVSEDDNDRSHDIAIQKDGKILAIGYSNNDIDNVKARRMAVTRYLTSGNVDPAFGDNGTVIINLDSLSPMGAGWAEADALVVQENGKIVIGGKFRDEFTLVRLNKDGNLDSSFGKGGVVITSIEETSGIKDIHLLKSGKILAIGYCIVSRNSKIALAQYKADGTLDNAFGKKGIVTTKVSDNVHSINAVDVQNDEKIVVAGMIVTTTSSLGEKNDDFLLLRYNKDGSLDDSFGDKGISVKSVSESNDRAKDLVIQEDGRIIVVGYAFPGKDALSPQHALVRFNSDGSFDKGFGKGGSVITKVGSSYDEALGVMIQPDNKILVAGNAAGVEGIKGGALTLLRFYPNGSLDMGFGERGISLVGKDGFNFFGTALLMQEDKKIVVGGYVEADKLDFVVARFFFWFGSWNC